MGYELGLKVLVLSLAVVAVAGIRPSKLVRQVPAMYVLGDSTLDVGNNNYLPGKDVPRANKPFYGVDLPGSGKPTGRFSNGYNTADFVAKTLGFDKSPLAYLMLKAHNKLIPSAITRGVSFASAGAGILDSTVRRRGVALPISVPVPPPPCGSGRRGGAALRAGARRLRAAAGRTPLPRRQNRGRVQRWPPRRSCQCPLHAQNRLRNDEEHSLCRSSVKDLRKGRRDHRCTLASPAQERQKTHGSLSKWRRSLGKMTRSSLDVKVAGGLSWQQLSSAPLVSLL